MEVERVKIRIFFICPAVWKRSVYRSKVQYRVYKEIKYNTIICLPFR